VAARSLRRGLTGIQGHANFTRFCFQNSIYKGRRCANPIGTIFPSQTVYVRKFTGSSRVALTRSSQSRWAEIFRV
jgi:hypothetical protein